MTADAEKTEIASPCVGICTVDGAGVCLGCGRTLAEIAVWPGADDGRKRAIVGLARDRLSIIEQGHIQERGA